MENENVTPAKNFIDVRYSKYYSISQLVISGILLIPVVTSGTDKEYLYYFCIILALIFVSQGIYSLLGGKTIRLDIKNKNLKKYSFYGSVGWNYKYDRLFFMGKELYRELDGKIKFINILPVECNKKDLEVLIAEVNKE